MMAVEKEVTVEILSKRIIDFVTLFSTNNETKIFFSYHIKKLENINERLINNKVEIGVIGITSSGKSTLLNAILGEKMLPQKVKPSSGVQVICEYGEKMKAVIFFNGDSKKKPILITKNFAEEIENYGCESKNPGNRLCVEEIRLFSDKFRLNHNIVLVDTPGLDAYDLKNHEEITLRLVLPSVQMVIFMTTVKGSSDKTNLSLIDRIMTEDKPLLVVQNMIDSIAPKESIRGIEKDKVEVQKEHRERLSDLLLKAEKKSVRFAPIIQISAQKAKVDWKTSAMDELVIVLNQLVEDTGPKRLKIFQKQISTELLEIKQKLEDVERSQILHLEKMTKINSIQSSLNRLENKLTDYGTTLDKEIEQVIIDTYNLIKNIEAKYPDTNPKTLEPKIKKDLDEIKNDGDRITENLSNHIKNIQQQLIKSCEKLNLQSQEIIRRQVINYFSPEMSIPIRTEKEIKTRRVEKSGIINTILRWFSNNWGYKEEKYEVSVDYIDIKKLCQRFIYKRKQWKTFIETSFLTHFKNTKFGLNKMQIELNIKKENEEKQLTASINYELGKEIVLQINNFIKENNFTKITDASVTYTKKSTDKVLEITEQKCSKLAVDMFQLAHYESFKPHFALRDKIILRNGNNPQVLIWGWDEHLLNRFVDYFFSDVLNGNYQYMNRIKIDSAFFSSITLINENNYSKGWKFIESEKTLLFVLLNSTQSGSAESKLRKSKLLQYTSSPIVWVMDSINDLITDGDDRLIEGFAEFIRLIQSTGKRITEIMVSDRDLFYTVLLNELFFNSINWKTKNNEQQFLKEMRECFSLTNQRLNKTGEYIKLFQNLNI